MRNPSVESRLQADSPSPTWSHWQELGRKFPDAGNFCTQIRSWEGSRPDVLGATGRLPGWTCGGGSPGSTRRSAARFGQSVVSVVPLERWGETGGVGGSSIAFLTFHVAYHEDVAVNAVLRGGPPVLRRLARRARLGGLDAPPRPGRGRTAGAHCGPGPGADSSPTSTPCTTPRHVARRRRPRPSSTTSPDAAVGLAAAASTERAVPWLYSMWTGRPASLVRAVGGHRPPCQPRRRDGLRAQPDGPVAVLSDTCTERRHRRRPR